MANSYNATDSMEKKSIDNPTVEKAATEELTAEEYRKRAEKYKDAIRNQWKIFGRVGVFLLAAMIALLIFSVAWFAVNNKVSGTGTSVSAAPSDFELAAKVPENDKDAGGAWDSLLSEVKGEKISATIVNESTQSFFVSPGSSKTDITWAITNDSNMGNYGTENSAAGLSPGASGELTFYLIANRTGTLHISLDLSMVGYKDKNRSPVSSDAGELLEGHILLFAGCSKNNGKVSYKGWISEDADPWSVALSYPVQDTGTGTESRTEYGTLSRGADGILTWTADVTAGTAYPVTIYWIWPEVLGQYLTGPDSQINIGKHPGLFTEVLPSKLFQMMQVTTGLDENGTDVESVSNRYFKWASSADEANDKVLAASDFQKNVGQLEQLRNGTGNLSVYSNLCVYYNRADQYIGENVRYVYLKLTANE